MLTLIWPVEPVDINNATTTYLTLPRTDVPPDSEDDFELQILNRKLLRDENSTIYRATLRCEGDDIVAERDVVCKVAVGKKNVRRLRNEARFYAEELKELQHDIVPICYGLYEVEPEDDDLTAILITGYCGERPKIPLFGQPWELKIKIVFMLKIIHEAGVMHGDFGTRNVVVDSDGEPWIIDFDNAQKHICGQKMEILSHTKEPLIYDFGCDEIWETCHAAGMWTPRSIRYLKSFYPIECATSVDELVQWAPGYVDDETAYEEAVRSIQNLRKYLQARLDCDWKGV